MGGLDYAEEFAIAAQWFARHVVRASMDAPVPACPDWSVLDLTVHLGNVHSWAASVLETGCSADVLQDAPVSHRPRRVAEWYEGRAEDLYAVLRATPSDRPCWNFAFGDGVAGFWHRRQVHETVMHGVDLAAAAGVPERLPAALAADGIDEALTVFLHRMHSRGHPATLSAPIVLRALDTGDAWTVAPGAAGESPLVTPSPSAGDLVEAPAGILLKLLWKRLELDPSLPDGLEISGDEDRVRRFLAGRLTA